MFDEWVGVITSVPRSAHASACSVAPSTWIRMSICSSDATPSRRLRIGDIRNPSARGPMLVATLYTRGSKLPTTSLP
jgi:hypothetical protein